MIPRHLITTAAGHLRPADPGQRTHAGSRDLTWDKRPAQDRLEPESRDARSPGRASQHPPVWEAARTRPGLQPLIHRHGAVVSHRPGAVARSAGDWGASCGGMGTPKLVLDVPGGPCGGARGRVHPPLADRARCLRTRCIRSARSRFARRPGSRPPSYVLGRVGRPGSEWLTIQTSPRDPTWMEIPRARFDRLWNPECDSHRKGQSQTPVQAVKRVVPVRPRSCGRCWCCDRAW